MKFLPYSNGVQKLSMKREWKPIEIVKLLISTFLIIFLTGFIVQRVLNFIGNEKIKARVDYTRVNDKRMDYILKGSGEYTVIFDGALGTELYQWDEITDKLEELGIASFVYNRNGYGLSDSNIRKSPEEQANDLKILLRKAGASAPYILVGEEYGSLVLSNFAKSHSEDVVGAVFVNPLSDESLKDSNFKKEIFFNKGRRAVEKFGSTISLTALMNKVGLTIDMDKYIENLNEKSSKEFKLHRTKKSYTTATYNETINLYEGVENGQVEGMFKGKPYYILSTADEISLKKLGDEQYTKSKIINLDNKYAFIDNEENIVEAINYVVKEAKIIEKKNLKNN